MIRKTLSFATVLFVLGILSAPASAQVTHYQTNFDSLTVGTTLIEPGRAGQDGWFNQRATGTAFGEIQSGIANTGNALHEFTAVNNFSGEQTIDRRNLSINNLSSMTQLTLEFDFYAHTSDLSKVNPFTGLLLVEGVEQGEVFTGIGAGVTGGNGNPKSVTGASLSLDAFNGVDNNVPISLSVGQGLSWDAWHRVVLTVNPSADRYTSLTVDGITQALGGFQLPRGFAATPVRGNSLDRLTAQVVSNNTTFPNNATDDDIYWDNIRISSVSSASAAPEPGALALLTTGVLPLITAVRRRRNR